MGFLVVLALFFVGPVVLLIWGVRVYRRWTGSWRYVALMPGLVCLVDLTLTYRGGRDDPMGHSGWPVVVLGLTALGLLAAYILSELHAAYSRRRARSGIAIPPPNER